MIKKIVSGGQTGVDRAALDVAIKLEISHGGWCPRGRVAEDGTIPEQYKLQTPKDDIKDENNIFNERTKLNIRDSDGTLILVPKIPLPSIITDGTNLTIKEVMEKQKPYFICDLSQKLNLEAIVNWIKKNNIKILNVAGPRESQSPGIYKQGVSFLEIVLPCLAGVSKIQEQTELKNSGLMRSKL